MGVEGSIGISPASEGHQETLPTLAAAGAFRADGELGAEALQQEACPEQNFTGAAELGNPASEAAAWSAGRKQSQKYPLLVVHPKFIYSDILWCIILAPKDSLVSWKLPGQLWFDIQQVC